MDSRYAQSFRGIVPDLKKWRQNEREVRARALLAGELASVRDDMIRAPTAMLVFTIRSFEPLARSRVLASFLGESQVFLTALRVRGIRDPETASLHRCDLRRQKQA